MRDICQKVYNVSYKYSNVGTISHKRFWKMQLLSIIKHINS